MIELDEVEFDRFFARVTDSYRPFDWQRELGDSSTCDNRLIRIPTGFGKTLGVLATWLWHRVRNKNNAWPHRLVWCLPMRVLAEQTESEIRAALVRLDVLWDGKGAHDGRVGVHLLMGGADAGRWHLYPEADAVLVGTQDMLLSRAMNRGYASPRARWPMEFGALNQDALWVMDEVQLMDVGFATSGQLQAFRDEEQGAGRSMRPCFTWWMSATLQRDWLEKSPDTGGLLRTLEQNTYEITPDGRTGHLWNDVKKTLEIVQFKNAKELGRYVSERHRDGGCGKEGLTLVIVNTVQRVIEVWNALKSDRALKPVDVRLVHSRFRPAERKNWRNDFLNRAACCKATNRIVVATQVIEAGVDISASLLITELAPWPSLVQRFGRSARWGGKAEVIVADLGHDSDRKAAPYSMDELAASRVACGKLSDVGPIYLEWFEDHLEQFEEEHKSLRSRLYPYPPPHLLLRHELDELFDTSPDLSGSDIDISRFIRSGDERDVQVFWMDLDEEGPSSSLKPTRDELCNVPFLDVREWLCTPKSERLRPNFRAWVWDWLNREWREVRRRDISPGQTVLVEARVGGYRDDQGWGPTSAESVELARANDEVRYVKRPCWIRVGDGWRPSERRVRSLPPEDHADAAEDDESLSVIDECWQTIASHGNEVGETAQRIASLIAPDHAKLLHLAGRWHDLGKAHPAFQSSIRADSRPQRHDIAKAPEFAWPCSTMNMYRIDETDQRNGFRHELASTMGLFGVLQRHDREHQALLGPWREWFDAMEKAGAVEPRDTADIEDAPTVPTIIEREILSLRAGEFDLVAYLVCAHHGKVRMVWHASPADQKANDFRLRIRGVVEGDVLPPLQLAAADGEFHDLPSTALGLSPSEAGLNPRTGRSWTERVLGLLDRFGPFTLAWLEAILRAADQRASMGRKVDRLLVEQEGRNPDRSLELGHQTLAQSTPRDATGQVETAFVALNRKKLGSLPVERMAVPETSRMRPAQEGTS